MFGDFEKFGKENILFLINSCIVNVGMDLLTKFEDERRLESGC